MKYIIVKTNTFLLIENKNQLDFLNNPNVLAILNKLFDFIT